HACQSPSPLDITPRFTPVKRSTILPAGHYEDIGEEKFFTESRIHRPAGDFTVGKRFRLGSTGPSWTSQARFPLDSWRLGSTGDIPGPLASRHRPGELGRTRSARARRTGRVRLQRGQEKPHAVIARNYIQPGAAEEKPLSLPPIKSAS